MSFRQEEIKLGEYTFQINTLPYSDAQKVLLKAKDLLMLKVADTGAFEEGSSPLSAAVFMDIEEDKLEFVINKMAEKTLVKQEGGQFLSLQSQKEIVFAGHFELMFKWLDKALELNFGGFLDGLRKATQAQATKSASPSRKK